MIKTCEGIVIRQTKIVGGRRMVLVFTREEGKLSAGTHISEKSKGDSALAIRPFTYGRYTVNEKSAGTRSISSAETLDAHFGLGEDIDRFTEASFVLEFTDKVLPEGAAAPRVFDLLKGYLAMLAGRKVDFRLLTISYIVKVMQEFGVFPDTASLAEGLNSPGGGPAVTGGGPAPSEGELLLSGLNGDILNTIVFIAEQPLERMDALRLEGEKEGAVFGVIKAFAHEYLELGTIKSERLLSRDSAK